MKATHRQKDLLHQKYIVLVWWLMTITQSKSGGLPPVWGLLRLSSDFHDILGYREDFKTAWTTELNCVSHLNTLKVRCSTKLLTWLKSRMVCKVKQARFRTLFFDSTQIRVLTQPSSKKQQFVRQLSWCTWNKYLLHRGSYKDVKF